MGLENPLHIAVLLIVILLVFGAKRLPEMGRSLGSGMREFKDSISGSNRGDRDQASISPAAPPETPSAPAAPPQSQPPAPPPAPPASVGDSSEHHS